jgi:glycosyltransferase involved in cell wall biosynthesis
VKVAFTLNPYEGRGGGAHSFARTLAEWLPPLGVDVSFDLKVPGDCLLVFAHVGTPRLLSAWRRRGARVVHRLDERRDPGEGKVREAKHRRIERLNRYADLTIFQSEFVRENMGPICTAPAARVIHNGVDPRVFAATGPHAALDGSPAALHVSWSVGDSKRLDRIGELLTAGPPGLRVYCVGRHAESGEPWLRDPRVTLLGPRPREEVAALMRGATFLFFPSEHEPCPNTPLEALACGLPCLYHASGGTPEILGDAGLRIGASLQDDVQRLLRYREDLRVRALRRAPRFSAERAAHDYAAALADAMRAPATEPRVRSLWRFGRR